jgi:hypothetical protein
MGERSSRRRRGWVPTDTAGCSPWAVAKRPCRAPLVMALGLILAASRLFAQASASGEFTFGPAASATVWAGAPVVAALPAGGYAAVWQQFDATNGWRIFGQLLSFDSSGNLLPSTPFHVSTTIGCAQSPALAVDAAGNFAVVWQLNSTAIEAQYFKPGTPPTAVGSEQTVNTTLGDATHRKQRPAVAIVPQGNGSTTLGNFLVAWQSEQPEIPAGSSFGIFGRLYTVALSSGTPQPPAAFGGEFQINNGITLGAQHNPAVAWAPGANPQLQQFVVVWQSEGNGTWGIETRTFNGAGSALTNESAMNQTVGAVGDPAIAADPSGNYLVTWELLRPNGPGTEIEGRRFRSQAAAFESEFVVPNDPSNPTLYPRTRPAAALDASGDLMVAWESNGQDGSGLGVFAQGLSPQLLRNGFEFQVNGAAPSSAIGDQSAPSVASTVGGLAAIVWQGPNGAGTTSLFGHLYVTADKFYTVTPCRLVDTRNAANTTGGFQGTGAPALSNGVPRTFGLAGQCGIPGTAKALSLNVTVVPNGGGYIELYPGDALAPPTSTINWNPGVVKANNTVMGLSRDGQGTLTVLESGAPQTHFIIDVNGYFQ